jgi:cation transport ATPase
MPVCTAAQLRAYNGNPFELTCKPPNISSDQISLFLKSQVNNPQFKELFNQAQFSSDSLQIDPKTTEQVQFWYRILWLMPFITLLIIVFFPLILSFIYTANRFTTYVVHVILMSVSLGIEFVVIIFANDWFLRNFDSLLAKILSKEQVMFYNIYFKAGTSAIISDLINYQKSAFLWAVVTLVTMFVGAKVIEYVLKNRRNKVK